MKLAVLSIHRGDRPLFLQNLKRMIAAQTLQPSIVYFVDYEPESEQCDITQRYRRGYEYLSNQGVDLIAFMEVDDYYSPTYLETMVNQWLHAGKPDLTGTYYTYYYHIKLFAYYKMEHYQMSTAMATLIKPGLSINWCDDRQPYTDTFLWNLDNLSKHLFSPPIICIGIKHGVGLTGGRGHIDDLDRYERNKGVVDENKYFLWSNMDKESFEFYSEYFYPKAALTKSAHV